MDLHIEPMRAEDWPACRTVFAEGIDTGTATFETEAPDWEAWDRAHLPAARLVARAPDRAVVGWAALSPVSDRCAYSGVAEASVYVAAAVRGQGIGTTLLARLLAEAEAAGIWTVQAGILTENAASLALAQRSGFRVVGVRERIGKLGGRWRDVVMLERRSATVGID